MSQPAPTSLLFSPFRLDLGDEQLWRDTQAITLRPKTFALLRYLAEHAGRLATKDELLDAVWGEIAISEAVLKSCIRELRQALGDDAQSPRYVETVHRRGYRFVAAVRVSGAGSRGQGSELAPPFLAGREEELRQLRACFDRAERGQRQIVFVTGEPGIGKTALVDSFLSQITGAELWIGRGQCIEQYGAGEAYRPVLEALTRLCRAPDGEQVRALLDQRAPTWLLQMPGLVQAGEMEALQRRAQGASAARMLWELVDALEALAAARPLVLWIEDLHWSDASTVALLALLARRRERARVLVVGTYRPVDAIMRQHPVREVKQELHLHGLCVDVALGPLSEAAVAAYLSERFAHGDLATPALPVQQLAHVIHARTEGNPLFVINVVNDAVAQAALVELDGLWTLKGTVRAVTLNVPDTLRDMIDRQLDRLNQEHQRLLEAASVAGSDFSAAAVAAGLDLGIDEVEARCVQLARGPFLRPHGLTDWPDKTIAATYGFAHTLYRQAVYERLPAARRQRLHQEVGERIERGYGVQARDVAAELAMHFTEGRDYPRAVRYLQYAGENANQRSANQEALTLLNQGLELAQKLPDTPERSRQELALRVALGVPVMAIKGTAAPEAEQVYARARALCEKLGEATQLFFVLLRQVVLYLNRAELEIAKALGMQLLAVGQSAGDSSLIVQARGVLGGILLFLAEGFACREQLEQSIAIYDFETHSPMAFIVGTDPGVACLSILAVVLWLLGYPRQALQRRDEARALSERLAHGFSSTHALTWAAMLDQFSGDARATRDRAEALIAMSSEAGFAHRLAEGTVLRGWALTHMGEPADGIVLMQQGLADYKATGAHLARPYFLALLADAHQCAGQPEQGLEVLAEALAAAHGSGGRYYEAELYRLKGELTLQQAALSATREPRAEAKAHGKRQTARTATEAARCFRRAIDIAHRQEAKSLELRATMSLARLWQEQGKRAEARRMLAKMLGWFREGLDTKDLQTASSLLAELA